jgi:hypothetical protein
MNPTRKTRLATAIAAALVPWCAGAQTLVITQSGEGNTLQVRQPGAIGATATISQDAVGSSVAIDQSGAAHQAVVTQAADRQGSASIVQDGLEPAKATIGQTDTMTSSATVSQRYSRNLEASVEQARSTFAIADVRQTMSDGALADVIQRDSVNVDARVSQDQSSASVDILQQGSTSSFATVDQTASQAQVRIDQIDTVQSSATVTQSRTAGATSVTMLQSGNTGVSATVIQRDVSGDGVLVEQTGNRDTLAFIEQQGRSVGGPKGAQVKQTGNQLTSAWVFQEGGLQSALVSQNNNVGINGSIYQLSAWMPEATLEQSGNVAVESFTRITQIGSTHDDAYIVQRSNQTPTLRAGIVQSSAEAGASAWTPGSFSSAYFEPGNHLGGGSVNYMNNAFIRQTYANGARSEAGIAMIGVERSASSLVQNYNDGEVLALHRMVGTRNTVGSVTQENNAAGTLVSAEIVQLGGSGHAAELKQTANLGASVWMRAEQSGAQAVTATGLQTGSSSVFGLITQQEGSTASTAQLEQRNVSGGSAWVLQGTNDMSSGIVVPGHATALIALLNPDPGTARGAATASTAELIQSEGTELAARIVQTGTDLRASIAQTGAWKEASLIQNGSGHVGTIVQGGALVGSQASAVDLRQLGAIPQTATITQNSAGSRITVLQQ